MNIFEQLFNNRVIFISILSWAIAQIIKIILEFIENKKIDLKLAMSSGGMPSSHSSFVTAMSTAIGFQEGFNSAIFSICFVLSLIVMYDAAGVRRAAGKQAVVLNILIKNVEKQGMKIDEKLKELLGHTPIEVAAGAVLGIFLACVLY